MLTKRLKLIPIDIKMIDSLLESDNAFKRDYGFINDGGDFLNPHPKYLHDIKERLIACPEEYPVAVDYLIIIRETSTVIGTIYYKSLPENGVSEIGYGMNPKYEGHGYISETLECMLTFGRKHKIYKVKADTNKYNIKSQNILYRNGFSLDYEEGDNLWFSKENR